MTDSISHNQDKTELVEQAEGTFRRVGGFFMECERMTEAAKIDLVGALKIRNARADSYIGNLDRLLAAQRKYALAHADYYQALKSESEDMVILRRHQAHALLDELEKVDDVCLARGEEFHQADRHFFKTERNFSQISQLSEDSFRAWTKAGTCLAFANGCDMTRAREIQADLRETQLRQREQELLEQITTRGTLNG
jgi:hypothetical protein